MEQILVANITTNDSGTKFASFEISRKNVGVQWEPQLSPYSWLKEQIQDTDRSVWINSPRHSPLESTRKCWESTLYCDRGQTLEQQGQMVEREKEEEEEKEMEEKEMEEKQIQEQKKEYLGNLLFTDLMQQRSFSIIWDINVTSVKSQNAGCRVNFEGRLWNGVAS